MLMYHWNYDDDVFVYTVQGENEWRLYEIYKIGEDDKEIMVLPFGNWTSDGNMVLDQSEKYLRRQNLMVIFNSSTKIPNDNILEPL